MKDDLSYNRRGSHPKWKVTSPKTKDDLTQKERPTSLKIKSTKNEDEHMKTSKTFDQNPQPRQELSEI